MKLLLLTFIFLFSTVIHAQTNVEGNMKYLALGDSYTIGESVEEPDRFPLQLVSKLITSGVSLNDPVIIAKTGWTTDELSEALNEAEPIGQFELVTLLIGVNNQYRGRDAEEFRNEFVDLLKRAAGFTYSMKNVIVVSIPDWGVTPFALKMDRDPEKIGKEIELFNSIKKIEAEKLGARYVYITDISKQAAEDETLLAGDKLHPSAKMYSLWVERILPTAKSIIDKE